LMTWVNWPKAVIAVDPIRAKLATYRELQTDFIG
jgi:hypothetical protein